MRMRHIIQNVLIKASATLMILLLSYSVQAQEKNRIDSLKSELTKNLADTTHINVLTELGEMGMILRIPYWDSIATKVKKSLANQPPPTGKQVRTAITNSLLTSLAGALNNIGFINKEQGDMPKALENYHKSLKIYEETGNNKGTATSLYNIGNIYRQHGNIPQALQYFQKSLKVAEEAENNKGVANSLNNIGAIYELQGDFTKALDYYRKSLEIREEIGNKTGISTSLNNIGFIYNQQGDIPNALEYYHKSLKINEEIGYHAGVAGSLSNIGALYNSQGDIPKALEYFHESLKIREEIGDKIGMSRKDECGNTSIKQQLNPRSSTRPPFDVRVCQYQQELKEDKE